MKTGAWPRLDCGEGSIAGIEHVNAEQARYVDQGEEPPAGQNVGQVAQAWESPGRYLGEEPSLLGK
jgi:hypothetical protein